MLETRTSLAVFIFPIISLICRNVFYYVRIFFFFFLWNCGKFCFSIFEYGFAAVFGPVSNSAVCECGAALSGSENTVTAAVSAPNLSREQAASLPSQNCHYRLRSNYMASFIPQTALHCVWLGFQFGGG